MKKNVIKKYMDNKDLKLTNAELLNDIVLELKTIHNEINIIHMNISDIKAFVALPKLKPKPLPTESIPWFWN